MKTCYCGGRFKPYKDNNMDLSHGFRGKKYTTVVCDACNHQTFFPQISQEDLDFYYSNGTEQEGKYGYYKVDYGSAGLIQFVTVIRDLFLEIVNDGKELKRPIRVFDAGCGNGNKVDAFRRIGVDAWGADIGGMQVKSGISYGNQYIEEGDILESFAAQQKKEPFDFVMMFHVLEHIANPINFLRKLQELMHPTTKFFCALPSATYLGIYTYGLKSHKWYNCPVHVNLFSPKSFCCMMEDLGWTVNSIRGGDRPDPFPDQLMDSIFGNKGEKLNIHHFTNFMKANYVSADFWSICSFGNSTDNHLILNNEVKAAKSLDIDFLFSVEEKRMSGNKYEIPIQWSSIVNLGPFGVMGAGSLLEQLLLQYPNAEIAFVMDNLKSSFKGISAPIILPDQATPQQKKMPVINMVRGPVGLDVHQQLKGLGFTHILKPQYT